MNFFEVETGLTNDDIENRVLYVINSSEFKKWVETKSSFWKSWINENEFKPETGNFLLLPNKTGIVEAALMIIAEQTSSNLNNGDKFLDVYDWENILMH